MLYQDIRPVIYYVALWANFYTHERSTCLRFSSSLFMLKCLICTLQLECMIILMKRKLASVMNSDWIINMLVKNIVFLKLPVI